MVNEKLISKDLLSLSSTSANNIVVSSTNDTHISEVTILQDIPFTAQEKNYNQLKNNIITTNNLIFTIQKNLLSAIEQQEELEKQAKQNQGNQSGVNIDNVFENVLIENKSLIDQVNKNIEKFNKVSLVSFLAVQIININNIKRNVNLNANIINLLIAHMQKVKILCIEDYINLMLNPYKYKFKKSYISEQPDTVKAISNGLLKIILLSLKSPEYVKTVQYKLTDSTNFTSVSSSQVETNCTEIVDNNTTVSTLVSQHNVASTLYKDTSTVNEKLDSSVYNKLVFNIQNIQLSIKDLNNKINEFQDNTLEEIVILGLGLLCDKIELQIKSIKEDFENNIANLNSEEINNIKLMLDNTTQKKQELSNIISNIQQGENENSTKKKLECDEENLTHFHSTKVLNSLCEYSKQAEPSCNYLFNNLFLNQLIANKININIKQLTKFEHIAVNIMFAIEHIHQLQKVFTKKINDKEYFEKSKLDSSKNSDYGTLSNLTKNIHDLSNFINSDNANLPQTLKQYLYDCIESLDLNAKILREIIRHFNYQEYVLDMQKLLILKHSPQKFHFQNRKAETFLNTPSYEQITENKDIILDLLNNKTILEIEKTINVIKNNTGEYFTLCFTDDIKNLQENESKFNLLKEIQLDKIIDLVQIPEKGEKKYKDLFDDLVNVTTKIFTLKSQFKVLMLLKLNDNELQAEMVRLNTALGYITKFLNKTDKQYFKDLSSLKLSPIQNEYINKFIHYIYYQWSALKILFRYYQDYNPEDCAYLLSIINDSDIPKKKKNLCNIQGTDKNSLIAANPMLTNYQHKLMYYLLDKQLVSTIGNKLKEIIFYYELNENIECSNKINLKNLDQKLIENIQFQRMSSINKEKDELYKKILNNLDILNNIISIMSDLLEDAIQSKTILTLDKNAKPYKDLILRIKKLIDVIRNSSIFILSSSKQHEIELLILENIQNFTTILRISNYLFNGYSVNPEDYERLFNINRLRLDKLQKYKSLEVFNCQTINLQERISLLHDKQKKDCNEIRCIQIECEQVIGKKRKRENNNEYELYKSKRT